jgi:cell division protein FtsB
MKDPSPKPRLSARQSPRRPSSRVGDDPKPRRTGWALAAVCGLWAIGAVAVIVVLFVFVFPTRTYLAQRHDMSLAAQRLQVLDAQNKQLAAEAAKLQNNDEIERLARARYHLVRPGEQAYIVLPPPTPTTTTPPPAAPAHHATGWWHDLISWLP